MKYSIFIKNKLLRERFILFPELKRAYSALLLIKLPISGIKINFQKRNNLFQAGDLPKLLKCLNKCVKL